VYVLDRDRVLRPRRARRDEALAAVDGARGGQEAWERLEARGLLPSGTVGEPGRVFASWMQSYDGRRTWHAVERLPAEKTFPTRSSDNESAPPTVGLACALASDWPGVLSAEAIARAVFSALRPWQPSRVPSTPAITWRLGVGSDGRGDTDAHCGDLWCARVKLVAFSGREVEEAGEIRAELHTRPAKLIGEVCALEDAYFANLWREAAADALRARATRDEERLLEGLSALGPSIPTDEEKGLVGLARMPVSLSVQRRLLERASRASSPTFPESPNVFDLLVALWNTGYAPALFTTQTIVLEAPPIAP
jgi:hypothetical protein